MNRTNRFTMLYLSCFIMLQLVLFLAKPAMSQGGGGGPFWYTWSSCPIVITRADTYNLYYQPGAVTFTSSGPGGTATSYDTLIGGSSSQFSYNLQAYTEQYNPTTPPSITSSAMATDTINVTINGPAPPAGATNYGVTVTFGIHAQGGASVTLHTSSSSGTSLVADLGLGASAPGGLGSDDDLTTLSEPITAMGPGYTYTLHIPMPTFINLMTSGSAKATGNVRVKIWVKSIVGPQGTSNWSEPAWGI
jgi:hypothetical protein